MGDGPATQTEETMIFSVRLFRVRCDQCSRLLCDLQEAAEAQLGSRAKAYAAAASSGWELVTRDLCPTYWCGNHGHKFPDCWSPGHPDRHPRRQKPYRVCRTSGCLAVEVQEEGIDLD